VAASARFDTRRKAKARAAAFVPSTTGSRIRHQIYMLVVYPKSKKDDLSDKETAILRELVKEL